MDKGLAGQDIQRSIALAPSGESTYALTDSNTSAAIPIGGGAFGSLHIVTLSGACTLTAYGSESMTLTSFEAIGDSTNEPQTIAVTATGWIELPSSWLSVPFLQIRTSGGATATARVFTKG